VFARAASPQDAPCAAELIASTMDSFGEALFGLGDRQTLLRALASLFEHKGNRFSHEYTSLVEVGGQTAGLLLAFPGRRLTAASIKMVRALPEIYGWRQTLQLLWLALPAASMHEASADEFYIAHLATAPEFRRMGIGKYLLQTADKLARAKGLPKLSLIVKPDNQPAVHLYLTTGFETVAYIRTPRMAHSLHSSGHNRMVKQLR